MVEVETEESEVQGHPQLHSYFQGTLGHVSCYLSKIKRKQNKTNKNGACGWGRGLATQQEHQCDLSEQLLGIRNRWMSTLAQGPDAQQLNCTICPSCHGLPWD